MRRPGVALWQLAAGAQPRVAVVGGLLGAGRGARLTDRGARGKRGCEEGAVERRGGSRPWAGVWLGRGKGGKYLPGRHCQSSPLEGPTPKGDGGYVKAAIVSCD